MILTGARRPVRVPEGRLVRSGLESGLEPGGGVGGDERNEQGALVDWFGPLISVPFLVWLSGSLRLCGIPGPIFILHYLTIIPFLPLLPFSLRLPFPFSLIFVAKALLLQYRPTPPVDEVFMSLTPPLRVPILILTVHTQFRKRVGRRVGFDHCIVRKSSTCICIVRACAPQFPISIAPAPVRVS
jgi:hypothetical protein